MNIEFYISDTIDGHVILHEVDPGESNEPRAARAIYRWTPEQAGAFAAALNAAAGRARPTYEAIQSKLTAA